MARKFTDYLRLLEYGGSIVPYREITKKGLRYKSAMPTEFSWVAVKGGKDIDKGYMDAVDLPGAKDSATKAGKVKGADSVKVLGRDGKVLATINLNRE